MEIILGAVVIIVLLLILGFGIDVVILGIVGVMCLISAASELLFLYFAVRLMLSKKRSALFSRIGRTEKRKYDIAFDMVGDAELPNVFPAEVVMKNRLYSADKPVNVRVDVGKKYVYDRNARLTIVLGVPLCTFLCAALGFVVYAMLVNFKLLL